MNFELILTIAMLVSGVVALIDVLFFAKQRTAQIPPAKIPVWADYARSFFPIFLIVLLLRSFLAEPFRIPSGSLKPTLLVGDFVLVNKYVYGIRLPVLHTTIIPMGQPHKGDIVVFRWPVDTGTDLIKRVVGVPGDHISYVNKVLYVNKIPAIQLPAGDMHDKELESNGMVEMKKEDLAGVQHYIFQRPEMPAQDFIDVIVPPNELFVMGDNRDDSSDSRSWGFVPQANVIGKAFRVIFSIDYNWNNKNFRIRWNRIGKVIH